MCTDWWPKPEVACDSYTLVNIMPAFPASSWRSVCLIIISSVKPPPPGTHVTAIATHFYRKYDVFLQVTLHYLAILHNGLARMSVTWLEYIPLQGTTCAANATITTTAILTLSHSDNYRAIAIYVFGYADDLLPLAPTYVCHEITVVNM